MEITILLVFFCMVDSITVRAEHEVQSKSALAFYYQAFLYLSQDIATAILNTLNYLFTHKKTKLGQQTVKVLFGINRH